MFYHEYPPPPHLQNDIQCLWMLEHDYHQSYHTHEHLWADTHVELIFSYGEPYYRKSGSIKSVLPPSFVIGPFNRELLLYSDGLTGLVAARFHPWGFTSISNCNMTALINNVLPASTVLNQDVIPLQQQLDRATRDEKPTLLAQFLSTNHRSRTGEISMVMDAAMKMEAANGKVKISDLTRELHIDPRRLQRLFLRETGMPAKVFARILRFNHAKNLIERDPDIPIASLTYETGYADQAHFTKNFKELFNYTPAEFKTLIRKFRQESGDADRDVVFLQDR